MRFNYVETVPIENAELGHFLTSASALLTALYGLETHFGLAHGHFLPCPLSLI